MALPLKLGIEFTQAEFDAMLAAAQEINNIIKAKIDFNLTTQERESLSKVGPERSPYMQLSVLTYGVDFPALNGPGYTQADAEKDVKVYGQITEILEVLKQSQERAEELVMAAGHFGWQFTLNQYAQAERYKSQNVEGAQVVYDGLKGAFEGQGPQGGNPQP